MDRVDRALGKAEPGARSRLVSASRLGLVTVALAVLTSSVGQAEEVLCGDTDLDGLFETEDIQQCLDSLTGVGPHIVRLVSSTVFEPHFDTPPFYNPLGFVELESDTTLDCQGSTIRGIDDIAKRAPKAWGPLWVVTNSDHANDSQSNIWVRNCEIDGGMPASYNEDQNVFDNDIYMGFALYGVAIGGIVDSHVHDTHHSCVYIRSSQDIDVDDNLFEACGSANNQGSLRQPAVYLFQAGQTVQERISVRRNRALVAGAALYNTRISEGNAEFQTTWMRDVLFENNFGDQGGTDSPCVMLRGVRGVTVRGNTCANTSGIFTSAHNTAFCSDNPATPSNPIPESNCLEDVLIEGNVLMGTASAAANGAIQIHDYHGEVTVRRNRVISTTRLGTAPVPCLRWQTPLRNFQVDGLCAMTCADAGVEQHPVSVDQVGVPANEQVILRDIVVDGAGAEGVVLRKRLEGLTVDRLAVRSTVGEPFRIAGELVAEVFTGLDLEGGPLPLWTSEVCPPSVPAFPTGRVWGVGLALVLAGVGFTRLQGGRLE